MLRLLFIAALISLTAGCATTPNPIALDTRNSIYVKDVNVTWSYADGKELNDPEYIAGKEDMIKKLKAAINNDFKNSPSGMNAAALEVEVVGYNRVGAVMGNIVGGANTVSANVVVKQIQDGSAIGTYKKVTGTYMSNHGVIGAIVQSATKPDVVGIMADSFAEELRKSFDAQ